jgi:hypothetical protein
VQFSDDSSSDTATVNTDTDGAGVEGSGDAVKHWVDASASIAADAVNEVNGEHTFTVTVVTNAPTGVTVDHVNITPTGDTSYITGTPNDCVADGTSTALTCQITVNSATVGSASIGADVSVQFSDDSSSDTATVNTDTDGAGVEGSGDASPSHLTIRMVWANPTRSRSRCTRTSVKVPDL